MTRRIFVHSSMRTIIPTLMLLLLLLNASSMAAEEPILIRFSHVTGENTPKGLGAQMFKQRAEERLAGKVQVEIYPNSERFNDDQVFTALQFGDIQLAAPSLAKFRAYSEQIQVYDLPFLFDDVDAVHRFQDTPEGQALLESMLPRGIRGLAYWDNGMRVMSAHTPLRGPGDVEGLTFRIEPSSVIEAQYKRLDATTLRLPFGKVFEALTIGLVDGQENAWSNIASNHFYEVQENFTETNHSYLGYMVITSTRFWGALPKDVSSTLEEILTEVSVEVNQIALKRAQEGRQVVKDAGVEILTPTAEEAAAWRDALMSVQSEFEAAIGADVIAAAKGANGD